jgi:uncharacterized protein YfiM (DUF2279 family)
MKFFIIPSLLLCLISPAKGGTFSLIQPEDSWTSFDKWQHFSFSLLITVQSGYILSHENGVFRGPDYKVKTVSAGISLSFGLLKEIIDSRRKPQGLFSWKDLVMDAGGTAAGLLFLETINP